ncbi:hypothetical protein LSCM1_02344 [Leishmania martiniquensis]|uniref:Ubiquitin-like domain-containing protein n=1 Tax=Leishmania martiniquensis TaxID=1580590 RepID=A0A836K9L0_9TRYP|nr:hypothetical protein LSCM1_02344 [Leishmania martiniquensis]
MEPRTDTMQPTTCVYVLSDVDGYKYKLVMQGDVRLLTMRKVKRYLQRASGIDPTQQLITFNSVRLDDAMSGKDAGLFDGAILRLQQVSSSSAALATCLPMGGALPRHGASSGSGGDNSFAAYPLNTERRGSRAVSAKCGQLVDEKSSRMTVSVERAAGDSVQRISSPRTLPPPLLCLPPKQVTSGAERNAGDAASRTTHDSEAAIGGPSPSELAGATIATSSTRQGTPQEASFAVSPESRDVQAYYRQLEEKVAALSLDNVRLREQLQVAARQAADASTDWRQAEEVRRLKAALAMAQQGAKDAERAAADRWRIKEEELVKELDLLREERRRICEETAAQEVKLQELIHSMEGEIRGLKHELHDKDDALQEARLSLAELRFRGSRPTDMAGRGSGCWSADRATHPFAPPASLSARTPLHQCQSDGSKGLDDLADTALQCLAQALESAAPLELNSANDTCVIPIADGLNVLVTLDRETERLYLYAPLLSCLPSSPCQRMQLYEMLLEGALLGKDTAGGGIGVSLESNLVLISVSSSLRHSDASALAATAAPFLTAAREWVKKIDELLSIRRAF